MKLLRWLLFPISLVYGGVTAIRNFLFDIGIYGQKRHDVNVIAVGNISTGGTGKTPFVESLINLIPLDKNIAVISRGYGRKTKGFRLATQQDTAETIGDEPFQLFKKHHERIHLAVAEKRRIGIAELLRIDPNIDVVLLDDAFQHRWVSRDLNILLTTSANPFYSDYLLPTGNLRESRYSAKRADIIIVTKCSRFEQSIMELQKKKISSFSRALVNFSMIDYGQFTPVFGEAKFLGKELLLLTGIADASSLKNELSNRYQVKDHFEFGDHHVFNRDDLDQLNVKLSQNQLPIVTTEKDMVRLLAFKDHDLFKSHALFYIPIEMNVFDEKALKEEIMKVIQ